MLKIVLLLALLVSTNYAGYVSKKQFLNIIDFNTAVEEVITLHQEYPEFKKYTRYLFGIYYQESSLGLYSYSDTEEDKVYYIHNNKKVYISKEQFHQAKMYKSGARYIEVKMWGKYWKKHLHVLHGQLKPIVDASIGPTMFKVNTARLLIRYYHMKKYYKLLNNDKAIVNKLLNDLNFSVYLTFMYMKYNYDIAVQRNYDRPLDRAIGMHNGGWRNWSYVTKVKHGIKMVVEALEENRYNIKLNEYLKSKQERINHIKIKGN